MILWLYFWRRRAQSELPVLAAQFRSRSLCRDGGVSFLNASLDAVSALWSRCRASAAQRWAKFHYAQPLGRVAPRGNPANFFVQTSRSHAVHIDEASCPARKTVFTPPLGSRRMCGFPALTGFRVSVALPRRLELALPRLVAAVLWVLALAVAAWICASWYWRLRSPVPLALPASEVTDPVAAARGVSARHLFGEPAQNSPAQPVSRFVLLGVAANSGRSPGFAILQEEGKPAQGFIVGEEVSPGAKLVAIHAESVEIERSGARETVKLVDPASAHAAPVQSASAMPGHGNAPMPTPSAQPSVNMVQNGQLPQANPQPQPQPQSQTATQPTNDNSLNQ
ncbi:type II secretion system protein N [Niveibacterium terrae]|uniref:type II secretion system protein N n=1 Tax=Niveibacterium terrae TaxID=3373598 RepID=UPI003A8CCC54